MPNRRSLSGWTKDRSTRSLNENGSDSEFCTIAVTVGVLLPLVGTAAYATATSRASVSSTTPIETSQLNQFADQVQTLGQTSYPDSFAGAELTSSGQVLVYAVPSSDASLLAAIKSMNSDDFTVTVVPVGESWSELSGYTENLVNMADTLAADGLHIYMVVPNPATSAVDITLSQPTPGDLNALAAASGLSVTSDNFLSLADSFMTSTLGYTVVAHAMSGAASWTAASGRYSDTSPFSGGDEIFGGTYGAQCTSGFATFGSTGDFYMLGAGHCGGGTWYTDASGSTNLGDVTKAYWNNGEDDHFSTIYVSTQQVKPQVWYSNTAKHNITGWEIPAKGSLITVDGSITGEVPGNTVKYTNSYVYTCNSLDGVCAYVGPSIVVQNPSGKLICQSGGSGGPMYVRLSTDSDAYAISTISAFWGTSQSICAGQQIGTELSHANLTLYIS